MKNIQIIDSAHNAVFDIFAAAKEEFSLIFADGHDVAFIDEVMARRSESELNDAFNRIWTGAFLSEMQWVFTVFFFTSWIIRSNTIQHGKKKRHVIPMAHSFDKIRYQFSF